MRGISNIFKKELTRVFTDKKMIFSLFILPAVMMVGLYSLMGSVMSNFMNDVEAHVPTLYIQNAPENFEDEIAQAEFVADIQYLEATEDLESLKDGVLNGMVDLIVVFEDGFMDKINNYSAAGDPIPEVKTFYNSAEEYSLAARDKFVNGVLNGYQQKLLTNRLGNIEQLQVFYIDKDPASSNIVDEKKEDGKFFSMLLPFLINIMLFAGAMSLCVDAITGEKERGTLSSMLLTPIKRGEIVFGKLTSLAVLSAISAAVYAISLTVALPMFYGKIAEGSMGGGLSFTVVDMLQLFLIMMVCVYLYVALVSVVAVYAKTSKEANTYVMPVYILVMLGGLFTFSGAGDNQLNNFFIPVYNVSASIQNLIMGELTWAQLGITVGSTALLAAVITTLITKAFNSEKVMFNA